ncbi:uncharacterized protein LOC118348001 [Juglans regia]|uniref:Uncharacterized protein LOC118348001 n=1 Tax=Juglans regia TaxID=51240 RepID=A0A6P9EBA5_JUGRE|nr:uncharacterized protein LOC118348001 [Juglans regia]
MVKLAAKLKRLKVELRIWNKSVFGRVDTNIQELDAKMEREESRLAQLAKNKWLKEGDQNSKFFHAVVSQRRHGSVISQMRLADGTMLDSAEKVHLGAVEYFTNFLTDMPQVVHADLSPLVGLEISEEDNSSLCHRPLEEEVKEAVFSIPEYSSPGPDGYGSSFYISCWHLVKEEVVEAARDFFAGSPLPRFYTSSYIVLIPKVLDPKSFEKFRPISLCSVAYKIFSKILVKRLTGFLPRLISAE